MTSTRVRSLYAFGDSLVDDGKTIGTFPLAGEFGAQPFPVSPPYAEGRYSNGPMWTEYLADSLGSPSAVDRNFAIGGATSGVIDDPSDPLQTLGSFGGQIELFEEAFGTLGSDDLVTVTFGGNDLPLVARAATEAGIVPTDGVALVIDNIVAGLDRLAALGATRLVVTNLPDLALVPFVRAEPEAVAQEFGVGALELTALTRAFNAALDDAVSEFEARSGTEVIYFDTFDFFAEIVADPARAGLVNIEEEVLSTGSTSLAPAYNPAIDGRDPDVANVTLFFDQDFHPTTAVHARLADAVAAQLIEEEVVSPGPGRVREAVQPVVALLFEAVLDRAPDAAGLLFWTNALLSGQSAPAVAAAFLASEEYIALAGMENDEEFLTRIYDALFDRSPDADGLDFWAAALETSAVPRSTVALAIATGEEGQALYQMPFDDEWLLST